MRLLPMFALLAACGGSPQSYCRMVVDCYEGDPDDYEDCVNDMDRKYDDAADQDCLREYDTYIDCVVATGECDGDKVDYDNDCHDLRDDYEDCKD